MLTFLKLQLAEVEEELKGLYEARRKSDVGTGGNIEIRIDKLKKELEKLTNDIKEAEAKLKTPDQVQIFFYVVVLTKEKVKQNLGEINFHHLEEDRYHDSEINQWKPYRGCNTIIDILSYFRSRYTFQEVYIDDQIADEIRIQVDENIENSIAIIDVLSVNDKNKEFALRFDTKKAGLIMPFCASLFKNDEIQSFAGNLKTNFKTLNAHINKISDCPLYFGNVTGLQYFQQHLTTILSAKFPITNQSSTQSSVRNINIAFQ